jgi:hypothetical protein
MRKRRDLDTDALTNAQRSADGDVNNSLTFCIADADALGSPAPCLGCGEAASVICCIARCRSLLSAYRQREVLQAWAVLP